MKCQTTERSTVLDTNTIHQYYFYTIKGTQRYPQKDQYERILKKWEKQNFYPQMKAYELDSIGKLHVHGIAISRPNYLLNRLNKKRYSVHVLPLETEKEFKNCLKYSTKEPQNGNPYLQEQFLDEYAIRTASYPFLIAEDSTHSVAK